MKNKESNLFYLTECGLHGDIIAQMSANPNQEGKYKLTAFDPEEKILAIDLISAEDAKELRLYQNNPGKAFDECGADSVFFHKSTERIKEISGEENIIIAILNDEEVCYFMEEYAMCCNLNKVETEIHEYMETVIWDNQDKIIYNPKIPGGFDENFNFDEVCNNIITESSSLKDSCQRFFDYCSKTNLQLFNNFASKKEHDNSAREIEK